MTWPVNTSRALDAALAMGVTGIISDEAAVLADAGGTPPGGVLTPARRVSVAEHRGEHVGVLDEVTVGQEPVEHPEVGARAEPRRRSAGSRRSESTRPAMASRSRGSSSRRPLMPCSTWSWMPPTAEATTGRAFHIGSVTVRPKPSTRLFWTTTEA